MPDSLFLSRGGGSRATRLVVGSGPGPLHTRLLHCSLKGIAPVSFECVIRSVRRSENRVGDTVAFVEDLLLM